MPGARFQGHWVGADKFLPSLPVGPWPLLGGGGEARALPQPLTSGLRATTAGGTTVKEENSTPLSRLQAFSRGALNHVAGGPLKLPLNGSGIIRANPPGVVGGGKESKTNNTKTTKTQTIEMPSPCAPQSKQGRHRIWERGAANLGSLENPSDSLTGMANLLPALPSVCFQGGRAVETESLSPRCPGRGGRQACSVSDLFYFLDL